jgi:hypothetical protein
MKNIVFKLPLSVAKYLGIKEAIEAGLDASFKLLGNANSQLIFPNFLNRFVKSYV